MDCSQLVLSVIKDETIKANLNPIVYYTIKLIYDPEFSKRSRYFCRALTKFFNSFGKNLNLHKIASTLSPEQKTDNTLIIKLLLEQSLNLKKEENGSIIRNSNRLEDSSIDNIFKHDWGWYIDTLLDYDNTYILDKNEDYCLLLMLQDFNSILSPGMLSRTFFSNFKHSEKE